MTTFPTPPTVGSATGRVGVAGCSPHAVLSILTFHLRGPLGNHGYRLGKGFSQLRGHGEKHNKKKAF